jgi:hypothetical protein
MEDISQSSEKHRFSLARVGYPLFSLFWSAGVLYLFRLYGSLVSWWIHAERQGFREGQTLPSFYAAADQLYVLAILLSLLNLLYALCVWRGGVANRQLSIFAFTIAGCVLLLCLIVNF